MKCGKTFYSHHWSLTPAVVTINTLKLVNKLLVNLLWLVFGQTYSHTNAAVQGQTASSVCRSVVHNYLNIKITTVTCYIVSLSTVFLESLEKKKHFFYFLFFYFYYYYFFFFFFFFFFFAWRFILNQNYSFMTDHLLSDTKTLSFFSVSTFGSKLFNLK